jgi:serine/threonine protein kinase
MHACGIWSGVCPDNLASGEVMSVEAHRFGAIAEQLGLAARADVDAALQKQITLRECWAGSRIGEILILMGVLDGLQVERILAEQVKRRHVSARAASSERAFQYYNRYMIVKKLGEGGMGEVFLAREVVMDRLVVLKMLRKDKAVSQRIAERFALEARVGGALGHANIVAYHNTGFAHGVRFLVMEYVEGETLQDRISRERRIPEREVLRIGAEILKGLVHLHAKGIIHRDIKPANILISSDESVKLSDFGSARLSAQPFSDTNTIVGTPNYIPPEQVRATASIDHRADLYALGATLYHALAGRVPFDYPATHTILRAHVDELPPALQEFNPQLSSGTIRIIEKLMAKDPTERYATAQEALGEIENALSPPSVQSKREFVPRWPRLRRRRAAGGVFETIAWLGAAVLLAIWFYSRT